MSPTTTSSDSTNIKYYTLADVSKHTARNDIWISLHGKVYDVSGLLEDHPGGQEVLFEQAGKDATQAFEDVGHSDGARHWLEQFYIGELTDDSSKVSSEEKEDSAADSIGPKGNGCIIGSNNCTILFASALIVAAVAVGGAFFLFKRWRQ